MSKIDTSSAYIDAEVIETTADDELHLDDEPLEAEAKATDPIDIFGDLGLTGQGDIERGMVPDVMLDFAKDASGRIGLNPGSIAIPMISTAAVSIRHGWKIQPKLKDYTWKEKPAVWVGITGPSGVNKSAALDVGLEPLEKEEERWSKESAELMEEYFLQCEEHKIVMKAWREALKDGGRDNAGAMPRPPRLPKRKRAIIENSTMEQLIQIASENPDGLIQYKDELVGWIASFDAYSGGGKGGASQDRAAALSGYNIDYADIIQRHGYVTAMDPTCGSGGLLLRFAERMRDAGHTPRHELFVEGTDIEMSAWKMAYVQLAFRDIPARLILGNCLTREVRETIYTPAYHRMFVPHQRMLKADQKAAA